MIPEILRLGNFPIHSFGLMVALAIFAAGFRLRRSFALAGLPVSEAERFAFTGAVSGLVGARLWYLAEHWVEVRHDFLNSLLATGGFTFYGGFVVSSVVLYLSVRAQKIPLAKFMDSLGPALTLGYAVGRLGCQLSGDGDYGTAARFGLGMSYATGVVPTPPGLEVYPTPLYESTLAVVILWILGRVEREGRLSAPGARFGLYLVLTAAERFAVEFLRQNDWFWHGFSEAQVIALVLAMLGAALLSIGAISSRTASPSRLHSRDRAA